MYEVIKRGNGYKGYSMSNNAVAAYDEGEKPMSKWTKAEILNAAEDSKHIELLKKVPAKALKENLLKWSSWHHTSNHYNQTDFYKIDFEYLESLTAETIKSWKAVAEIKTEPTKRVGNIDYIEWSGTRSRPRANPKRLSNVLIEERGRFYVVFDENGNEILRKKQGSNGTFVYYKEKK